jgi:hypothetical protein
MSHPKTVEELLKILRDDCSVPDLRTYFNVDTPEILQSTRALGSTPLTAAVAETTCAM